MSGPASGPDPYALLEVPVDADQGQLDAAYARQCASLAPTSLAMYAMFDEAEGERLRAEIEAAYALLSDPARRAALGPATAAAAAVGLGAAALAPAPAPAPVAVATAAPPPAAAAAAPPPKPTPVAAVQAPAPPPAAAAPPGPASPAAAVAATAPSRSPGSALRPAGTGRRPLLPAGALADINADTEFSGALLRRLREVANASLADLAEITKISKRYLTALEENDFAALPPLVYVRGFVAEYARVLGLDPRTVAQSYVNTYRRYKGEGR